MTRFNLKTLRGIHVLLVVVLGISFLAKIADHVPGLAGTGLEKILKDGYEYLRDMSLLIAIGGVAYVTNVFQKRHGFVGALKEEWRDIIATKSALFAYTQLERPTLAGAARRVQDKQRARQDRDASPDSRIDEMLAELYAKENATAKPWRRVSVEAATTMPNGRGA